MLSSICSRRRCILACVKFRSRALTALNLLPSIATLVSLNSSRRRHSTTNSRQTLRMASPLSLRKSAIVYPAEAELSQIKLINKDIDRPDRIVIAQIVVQPLREQSALAAIIAHHKARHRSLRHITEESYHPSRFHTAWANRRHALRFVPTFCT